MSAPCAHYCAACHTDAAQRGEVTALTTREALIRTMARTRVTADRGDLIAGAELGEWIEFLADHLIASGAVVDAATLADDEALIYDELLPWCRSHEVERGAEVGSGIRHTLRALTAALTERGGER